MIYCKQKKLWKMGGLDWQQIDEAIGEISLGNRNNFVKYTFGEASLKWLIDRINMNTILNMIMIMKIFEGIANNQLMKIVYPLWKIYKEKKKMYIWSI